MEIMLKNKCCLYVIISIQFFSITICNLLIELPSYIVSYSCNLICHCMKKTLIEGVKEQVLRGIFGA